MPRAQNLLPTFQLQVPGLSNTFSTRVTKTWRRHELDPSKAKHPASRSLHLQAGAGCAACTWEGFNTDRLSPPGHLGKGLVTFFILHLPLVSLRETSTEEQATSSPSMVGSCIWTCTFEGLRKLPTAKHHCRETGFWLYWGWKHISRIPVLHPKKTILAAGKQVSPHVLSTFLKRFCCKSGCKIAPGSPKGNSHLGSNINSIFSKSTVDTGINYWGVNSCRGYRNLLSHLPAEQGLMSLQL